MTCEWMPVWDRIRKQRQPDIEMDALRDQIDPDDDSRCVDCGGELEDGNYTLICRECADVDD